MVFSSIAFLFYFLPAFLFIYFLMPDKGKNLVLFLGSLVFYGYGVKDHPCYLLLMVLAVVVNTFVGRKIAAQRSRRMARKWLAAGLCYNFSFLLFFKYTDFLVTSLFALFGRSAGAPRLHLVIPLGISFYTFQSSSYLADVYWKRIRAEKNPLTIGTYLCMFPQLIAGPVITYASVERQLKKRRCSFKQVEEGLRIFTIGLGMKVLLANRVGGLWNQVTAIGYESISTPLAWMGLAAFSFQIYFDFYGYSLMAKGLGYLLGFRFPDNFDHPYLSVSMTDFWRRWHITLGSWFREYVYIPLGGNRKHRLRNLLIVWILTGLWHGASWNFVLWGLFCGLMIGLEKLGLEKLLRALPLLGHGYMMILIPVSWLLFAVEKTDQILICLQRLFPFGESAGSVVFAGDYLKYGKQYAVSLICSLLFCSRIPERIYGKQKYSLAMTVALVLIFWGSVYCLYRGMDDPFYYFHF